MAREQATTIFLLLWLLYRRMVAGQDQRRELSEAESELFFRNVDDGCERQGAGIGNVQVFLDENRKPYVGHLDWWRALGWPAFNTPNMNHGRIIGLMRRLKDLDWRQLGLDPSDLETLVPSHLHALGLDPSDADTLADLVSLQQQGLFEWFKRFLLEECPHLEENIGAVSVETGEQERSSKRRRPAKRRKRTEPTKRQMEAYRLHIKQDLSGQDLADALGINSRSSAWRLVTKAKSLVEGKKRQSARAKRRYDESENRS